MLFISLQPNGNQGQGASFPKLIAREDPLSRVCAVRSIRRLSLRELGVTRRSSLAISAAPTGCGIKALSDVRTIYHIGTSPFIHTNGKMGLLAVDGG